MLRVGGEGAMSPAATMEPPVAAAQSMMQSAPYNSPDVPKIDGTPMVAASGTGLFAQDFVPSSNAAVINDNVAAGLWNGGQPTPSGTTFKPPTGAASSMPYYQNQQGSVISPAVSDTVDVPKIVGTATLESTGNGAPFAQNFQAGQPAPYNSPDVPKVNGIGGM